LTQVAGALNNSVPSRSQTTSLPSNRSNPNLTSDSSTLTPPIENSHSVPPRPPLVRSFSPIVLPPVTAASLSIKEIPTIDDLNRCNSVLSNAKMSRYLDSALIQKYCDPVADRLIREVSKITLYNELICVIGEVVF
jgi:hypothetical protein